MESRCCHLRLNGARCAMPALRGNDLCFHHDRRRLMARCKPHYPDRQPTAPLLSFAYMEDHTGILENLNAIARAFAESRIDHRQVTSLTYLMQTCLKTLRQMKQLETPITAEEMPTDVTYDDRNNPLAATNPPTNPQSKPDPMPTPGPEPTPGLAPNPHPDPHPDPAPAPDPDPDVDPLIAAYFYPEPVPAHYRRRRPAASPAPQPPAPNPNPSPSPNPNPSPSPSPSPAPNPALGPDLPPYFQTLTKQSPVTPVFPTLTKDQKITSSFSNTCDLKNENFPPKPPHQNPATPTHPTMNPSATKELVAPS